MMKAKKIYNWWLDGVASEGGGDSFVEPTPPPDDIILKLNLYELSSMFQERVVAPSGVPLTPVTVNTNPVGTIFDQSKATLFVRAFGATAVPTLTADGITFDGTTDRIELPLSTVYLRPLHSTTAVWSLRFWVKKGLDGAARALMVNQGLSATQNGFYIQLTALDKIRFYLGDGVAPAMVDFTSLTSLTVAMGATPVQININVPGGLLASSITIGSITETFTVTGGGVLNSSMALSIGSDGTTFFTGSFSRSIELYNRVLTAQEILDYQSFNPAVTTDKFTPIKQWEIDFNDSAYIFSDSGETTPIANGGFVRAIRNKITIPYNTLAAIVRKMTSASDAASPLWREADLNSNSVVEYDGTGAQTLTFGENLFPELGGVSTTIIVCKNDDTTFGSHMLKEGQYLTVTGSGYAGNAAATGSADQPYSVIHSGITNAGSVMTSKSNGFNILVFRRFGEACDTWSQNKIKVSIASGYGSFTVSDIGVAYSNGVPDWHLDGKYALLEKYMGYLTDAQVEEKIDYLKFRFGISGTL